MILLNCDNFESFISESKKPVLVDFSAQWCGPCKMMSSILETLEIEREDIEIAKVDIDEEAELAIKFGIMSIPAFIVFRNGEPFERAIGYMSKDELLQELAL